MIPAPEASIAVVPQSRGARSHGALSRWAGRVLRPFRAIPQEALDRSTGLYSRAGLFAAANEAMAARGAGAPVSMVLLECKDLREVWQIYGPEVAGQLLDRLVRSLRVLASSHGLAGRTGPTQFAVVLPGATRDKAVRLVRRALGRPARVELDARDSEIVLVPELLVDIAEPGAMAIDELYGDMCRELVRAQREELRRLHFLASERERHSRPVGLPPR